MKLEALWNKQSKVRWPLTLLKLNLEESLLCLMPRVGIRFTKPSSSLQNL